MLARMSERGIAKVVCKTRCADYSSDFANVGRASPFGMLAQERIGNGVAKAAPDACHFERVGETVVHEYASWQWKYLSFVLQSSERRREDEAVVVALKFGTVVFVFCVNCLLSESFVGYELLPVHFCVEKREIEFVHKNSAFFVKKQKKGMKKCDSDTKSSFFILHSS